MAKTDENAKTNTTTDSNKESTPKTSEKAASKATKADSSKVSKESATKSDATTAAKSETKTVKSSANEAFAVIQTGSKQYIVKSGTIIDIEKIAEGEKSVTFDSVLLVSDGKTSKVGQPFVEGAKVKASILDQKRDDKKIVFKFKRKTGYKKTQGHRQSLTTIKIDSISG